MNAFRALALLLALCACLLSAMPYAGALSGTADAFASFLPLGGVLAMVALILAWWRRAWVALVLAIVAMAGVANIVVPEFRAAKMDSASGDRQGQTIVIVSHNVAVANVDPMQTIAALSASGADILLLQEANGRLGPLLPLLKRQFPYGSACPGICDLAIFSRLPMERVRWRFRDGHGAPFGPPLFWTRVHMPNGRIFTLATLHQPWPLPPAQQAWVRDRLPNAVARNRDTAMVIAGDFNLTPWSAAMRQLDHGMAPLRRVTHGLWSFPARVGSAPWPIPLLPIDQMFVGPDWQIVSVERMARTGSDHFPIRVTLSLRN